MARAKVIAIAVATAAIITVAGTPALAHTTDALTLDATSVTPGATVTATAQWTADATGTALETVIALPPALQGAASWASASAAVSGGGSAPCVIDTPDYEAACLVAAPAPGAVVTVTASFTVPASTDPGTYTLTASTPASNSLTADVQVLSVATPAIVVSPTTIAPGDSANATATFTATTTGDIRVSVDLLGTGGNGTLDGASATATGLSGCALDGSARAYSCTWTGAVIGDTRTIVIPVVSSGTTPSGSTFAVEAVTNPNTVAAQVASTSLSIAAEPTPTPSPSATPTPTPTGTATTAVTTPPTGGAQLAATGAASGTLALIAVGLIAVGLAAMAIGRRRGDAR